jgi:hypothetical protein
MREKGDWTDYLLLVYLLYHLGVGHAYIKAQQENPPVISTPPSPQESPFVPYQHRPISS